MFSARDIESSLLSQSLLWFCLRPYSKPASTEPRQIPAREPRVQLRAQSSELLPARIPSRSPDRKSSADRHPPSSAPASAGSDQRPPIRVPGPWPQRESKCPRIQSPHRRLPAETAATRLPQPDQEFCKPPKNCVAPESPDIPEGTGRPAASSTPARAAILLRGTRAGTGLCG